MIRLSGAVAALVVLLVSCSEVPRQVVSVDLAPEAERIARAFEESRIQRAELVVLVDKFLTSNGSPALKALCDSVEVRRDLPVAKDLSKVVLKSIFQRDVETDDPVELCLEMKPDGGSFSPRFEKVMDELVATLQPSETKRAVRNVLMWSHTHIQEWTLQRLSSRFDASDVPWLMEAMFHSHAVSFMDVFAWSVVEEYVKVLAPLNPEARGLEEALRSDNPQTVKAALKAACLWPGQDRFVLLSGHLADRSRLVRDWATNYFKSTEISHEQKVREMFRLGLLTDFDKKVRASATELVQYLDSEKERIACLARLLSDEAGAVRAAACSVLKECRLEVVPVEIQDQVIAALRRAGAEHAAKLSDETRNDFRAAHAAIPFLMKRPEWGIRQRVEWTRFLITYGEREDLNDLEEILSTLDDLPERDSVLAMSLLSRMARRGVEIEHSHSGLNGLVNILRREKLGDDEPESRLPAMEKLEWILFGPRVRLNDRMLETHVTDMRAETPHGFTGYGNPWPFQVERMRAACDRLLKTPNDRVTGQEAVDELVGEVQLVVRFLPVWFHYLEFGSKDIKKRVTENLRGIGLDEFLDNWSYERWVTFWIQHQADLKWDAKTSRIVTK